jgi:bifunctional polynucleotide phosphatase/kinase
MTTQAPRRKMKRDYLLNAGADKRKELPIALFDFDWTIVKPQDGRRFPLDVWDWKWLHSAVPDRIRAVAQGHRIMFVTDQTKFWKLRQIQAVIDTLGVPITAIVGGVTKKPETTWVLAALGPNNASQVSFYVGDAAGRPGDWSDADKVLAERLGLPFHVADEYWRR